MKKQAKTLIVAVIVLAVVIVLYFGMSKWNEVEEAKDDEDTSISLLDISSDDVVAFSFDYEGETYSFVYEDDTWYLDSDRDFPVEQSTIEGKLSSAVSTTASQEIEIDEDNLADYGLDEPSCTITITDSDDNETIFEIGDENTVTYEYYCRLNESDTVYMIDSTLESMMSFDLYDVADMDDFPTISSDEIKELSVSDGTETIELDDEDDEDAYSEIAALYYSAHVDYDCEDLSTYGLDDPTYTIVIGYLEEEEEETQEESEESEETEDETEEETEETEETYDEDDLTILTLYIGDLGDDGYYVYLEGSTEVNLIDSSSLENILAVFETEEESEEETQEETEETEDETEEETEESVEETEEETDEESEESEE